MDDDDVLVFGKAKKIDVAKRRKQPPSVQKIADSSPRKSGKASDTTEWDEMSEVDGAFQVSLSPFMRKTRFPPASSSSSRPLEDLPFSKEIKAALRYLELPLAATVLLACGVLAGETLEDDKSLLSMLAQAESAINYVFIAEYVLRWYSRNLEGRYLLKFEMIVDLVSFLPFVLQQAGLGQFGEITFLRLLRVLRLQRYLRSVESFENIVGPVAGSVRPYQLELARVSSSLFAALFITAGLVYVVESPYNPNLSNYFQTFYFAVTTLTTVGFGDVTPVTPQGKAVVIGAILIGAGVVPYQISKVVEVFIDSTRKSVACTRCAERTHPPGANFCWRCGEGLPDGSVQEKEERRRRFRADLEEQDWSEDSDDYFS